MLDRLVIRAKVTFPASLKTVIEIKAAIEKLSPNEQSSVADWLNSRLTDETPAMLAAIDEGIRSSDQNGSREYSRAELEQKVRQ